MHSILLLQNELRVARKMRGCLEAVPGWRVAATASTLLEARARLDEAIPDLLLADLDFDDGPLTALLQGGLGARGARRTRLLVSALSPDDERLMHALRLGADAFVVHGVPCATLVFAVRQVLSGGAPMTPAIARMLRQGFESDGWTTIAADQVADGSRCLTASEGLLLRRLGDGFGQSEIAAELRTSVEQLDRIARTLYCKFHRAALGGAGPGPVA